MPRYQGSIVVHGDKVRKVRNSGWLCRHWQDVDYFEIQTSSLGALGPMVDAYMIAHLHDGGRYETPWADLGMMRDWLKRPVFRGVRVCYVDHARIMTEPHGQCEHAGRCLEHEQDRNVEPCERGTR